MVTANGLTRRVDVLEEAMTRRQCQEIAADHGIDPDELYTMAKRLVVEGQRLRGQGLVAWVATDVGVDAAEFETARAQNVWKRK
jgi:hypothetical protein